MKKIFNIILAIFAISIIITGCKKSYDDLYPNSNKPTSVPPSLVLNGILYDLYDAPYTNYEKWDQYFITNYDYYGNNRYDFGPGADFYATLKNVVKMEEEVVARGADTVNPYAALGKFFRAYFFTKMSLEMGDIPTSQALQGFSNLTPQYDAQKDVFKQAFAWLESANADLATLIANNDFTLQGDFYFGNDLAAWRKVVNSFRLRLLIHLSKYVDDPDLNVKQQFATIVANSTQYPLMESSSDNLQFVFVHPTNDYPNNPDNFGFNALRDNCSATYVGLLTKLQDPRVFLTSEPASALVAAGTSPTSFNAFVGANPGEDLGTMYNKANSGQYSLLNRYRYYQTYTGEPSIQIGYPEMLFNIAEAINRGWISSGPLGDAEAYYIAGIKASMAFYSIPETGTMSVNFYVTGSPGGSDVVYNQYTVDVDWNIYYNQSTVKYAGGATGLTQILQQKYLAMFRHSGLEAYYQYRRTGVPTFTTGPGTGNSQRIPTRFQYPDVEKTANTANYEAALQAQYNGTDDINGVMWLLK